jgi:hypothetical protein
VVLKQADADAYIAAPKLVMSPRTMNWRSVSIDVLQWDALVESEEVIRGRLWLDFNVATGKYGFNLQLHGRPVYGWHFRPHGRHRNSGCPSDFPANVGYPHEQFYIEGRGYHCARLLTGLGGMSHKEHLRAFCTRANIDFRPTYAAPQVGEQTVLHFEEDV